MSTNPYQSPAYIQTTVPSDAMWRIDEDGCLIVSHNTTLPDRCVTTNAPLSAEDWLEHNFFWTQPAYLIAATLVLGPLFTIVVHFALRKRCRLVFSLSPEIRSEIRRNKWWGNFCLFSGLLMLLTVMQMRNPGILIVLMIGFWIAALVFYLRGRLPLRIKKYQDELFWVKGFSPEFLASLTDSR